MSIFADERKLTAEREQLLEELEENMLAVQDIVRHLDPSGYNAAYARSLLAESMALVDKLQSNDHSLSWTNFKLDLIGRCMLSDRPQ